MSPFDTLEPPRPRMKPEVLALIPARGGSKSIRHKNIRMCAGKPLMAHSIVSALESKRVTRTVVSTDEPLYAQIARAHGAQTPFLRPREIGGDHSTDLEVFQHALDWLAAHQDYRPDICVHLRPTHPVRHAGDIDAVVGILLEDKGIDSVRSVSLVSETPYKMWRLGGDGFLEPVLSTDLLEPYNLPRQLLPAVYVQNASIDAVRTSVITRQRSMTGRRIFGYVMDSNFDIDVESELLRAETRLTEQDGSTRAKPTLIPETPRHERMGVPIGGEIAAPVASSR